jgi:hypothetical protein
MLKFVILIAVFSMMFTAGISYAAERRFNEAVTSPVVRPDNYNIGTSSTTVNDRVKNSPKYTVPNFNKKGSYGQAK